MCDVQEAMVSELKQRNRNIKDKKLLNKDEVYHGALEDILLGTSLSYSFRSIMVHWRTYCWVRLFHIV